MADWTFGDVARIAGPRNNGHPLMNDEVELAGGAVPLSWVRSSAAIPVGNFGDAASAVVVAALSGRPVAHRAFNSKHRRVVAIGTIGQGQSAGAVHVWGTGFDPTHAAVGPSDTGFFAAPDV